MHIKPNKGGFIMLVKRTCVSNHMLRLKENFKSLLRFLNFFLSCWDINVKFTLVL